MLRVLPSVHLHRGLFLAVALSACNALTGVGDLATGPSEPDPVVGTPIDAGVDGGVDGGVVDAAPSPYYPDASTPDDAAAEDPDAAPQVEAGPDAGVKRVFVTSTTTAANLGGLAGGDLQCSQRAQAVNLGGTWRAWLSTNTIFAVARITGIGPWYLTTGVLAVKAGQLPNSTINHSIDRDEKGALQSGFVWTGTGTNGKFLDDDCSDWTSNSPGGHASTGDTKSSSPPWTAAQPASCDQQRRLYCFEL